MKVDFVGTYRGRNANVVEIFISTESRAPEKYLLSN